MATAKAVAPSRRGVVLARMLEGSAWLCLRLVVDFLALSAAALTCSVLGSERAGAAPGLPLVAFPLLVMALLALRGMYRRRLRVAILDGVSPVVSSVSLATMVVVAVPVLLGDTVLPSSDYLLLWTLGLAAVGTERIALALLQRVARWDHRLGSNTLIVGAGEVGARVARRLADRPDYGLHPVGFLDADPPADRPATGISLVGSPDDLTRIAPLLGVEHIVIAFSAAPDRTLIKLVHDAQALGLRVSLVPRFFDTLNGRFAYESVGGLPLLGLDVTNPRSSRFALKHAVDRSLALLALLVLMPLLAAIVVAIRLSSPGPVLFRQLRVGRDGREFELLKFRSMRLAGAPAAIDAHAWKDIAPGGVEGDDRRTPIGRALRRFSLDELPQLVNVLRGDMSIVGPRPERPSYVGLFEQGIARYSERHRVKGGMTGWSQVNGLRGKSSLADRIEMDNWYIEHWSLALDAKIVVMTLAAVVKGAE